MKGAQIAPPARSHQHRAPLTEQIITAGRTTAGDGTTTGARPSGTRRLATRVLGAWPGAQARCDDRGSVAVLMCFIVLIGGLLVTFLVDAGAQLQAANRADTYSSEAARAASIAIGPVPTTGSDATLHAAAAARTYLAQAGVRAYTVAVTGPATVQVRVTVSETTPILGVSVAQTRTHTAQLQVGVSTGQALP